MQRNYSSRLRVCHLLFVHQLFLFNANQ